MPVTIQVASHPAKGVNARRGIIDDEAKDTGIDSASSRFLESVLRGGGAEVKRVGLLQSTLGDDEAASVFPCQNGLVNACLEAYNQHHHLVLRPDDVWIAIITQFSFYVNAHAEEMRSFFVAHEGQKELLARACLRGGIDFARMTAKMADLIQDNVLDKDLQAWIMPSFSTTTEIDAVVCSAIVMGAMKHYFKYRFQVLCGIPSVTLLGDVADWEAILARLPKLASFGPAHPHLAEWASLVTPVVQGMVDTFGAPPPDSESAATRNFWSRIAHYSGGGSGPTYLSGWITAFCLFSSRGAWQGGQRADPGLMSSWRHNDEEEPAPTADRGPAAVAFPYIDTKDVPAAWCEVNSGEQHKIPGSLEVHAVMAAGLTGFSAFVLRPGEEGAEGDDEEVKDTVQPFPAWFIYVKEWEGGSQVMNRFC
ncbi:hypothetical protein B0T26DRAFT_652665 [Lasiosphaeria miniovina]|uniref:DUF4419 domain-containing protein n=1 Tax=Lasiosphaeria miniovina TaxID=1954250 RepID=A0AA40A538_9PEZI|nr:uncharacterized protein B0T26DRAFT_652665 [Lasiosphaeria miniovina]KAK0709335.1 hypothetical protein B0T26DRAFT_652665 [Lasiosphaeria miniovina]